MKKQNGDVRTRGLRGGSLGGVVGAMALLVVGAGAALAGVGVGNQEAEPNESKVTATLAASGGAGMSGGDFLTGTTTGTQTTPGAGLATVDYFRVRTAAAQPGIYRHRLIVTTGGIAGHTGTIRGLSQSDGVIAGASDIAFQTSTPASTPARFNQWYGFGRQEEVLYRIAGTVQTNGAYSATLVTEVVTPIIVPVALIAGSVTIANDLAGGNTADTDMWLYDAALEPVAGAGNDGQNSLTRNLSPGVYYLAVSNFNSGNNLASPADDGFRSGNVLDGAGVFANGSLTVIANLGMRFTHASGSVAVAASKSGPYEVAWIQFTVAGGNNPTGVGSVTPEVVAQGADMLLRVTVTPGSNPASTGLAVAVNASSIGLASNVSLVDNGTLGDVTAGDNVFSRLVTVPVETPVNDYSLAFAIADGQGRSGNGSFNVSVVEPPPVNDLCTSPTPITSNMQGVPIAGTTVGASASFDGSGVCGGGADTRDVYYSLTPGPATAGIWSFDTCSTPGLDTVVSVHSACPQVGVPSLVDAQSCQDSTCGAQSGGARVFAALQSGVTYLVRVATKDPIASEFTLVVTAPPPPPSNDTCEGAVNASGAEEIAFNNAGATTQTGIPGNAGCAGAIAADVWYLWSPPEVIGNGQWRMTATGASTRAAVWTSPCPETSQEQIGCIENGGAVVFDTPQGASFLIQVGGTAQTPLVGDAAVRFTFVPNTGLCCTGSPAVLSITSQASCEGNGGTYQGDNTSGGFTGEGAIFASGNANQPIPDNSPAGLVDSVIVESAGEIEHMALRVQITHGFVGDLVAILSNGSTSVTLFERVGRVGGGFGSGTALSGPVRFLDTAGDDLWAAAASGTIAAGDYRPSGASNAVTSLGDFRGQPISGTWTLTLADLSLSDAGTLVSWALEFNPPTVCGGGDDCLADFDNSGFIDPDDLADYIAAFFSVPPDPRADVNGDGNFDPDDLADYIAAFFGPPCV